MKHLSRFSFLLIPILTLAGCSLISPTIQPTQEVTFLPATDIVNPTSTPTRVATESISPTATQPPFATLSMDSVNETMEPLLRDPMNCTSTCYLGITPGETSMEEAITFFRPLGFEHFEGIDPDSGMNFYTVEYESYTGLNSSVTFFTSDYLVESIIIRPDIDKQTEGSQREWFTYSPETLIQKYGQPSRVEFGLGVYQNVTINMVLYFDEIDLIALYAGIGDPFHFCPLTFPFDHVRLWMGANPVHPPEFPTVPLEKATSLTIDQFTRLMLGDPQTTCFTINPDVFNRSIEVLTFSMFSIIVI